MKNRALAALLISAALLLAQNLQATSYTWNGGTANWDDPANWTPNGVPAATDDATINGGTVSLTVNTTIQNLVLNGGNIDGNFDLTVNGTFDWATGELQGSGTVSIMGLATLASGGGKTVSAKTLKFFGGANFLGLVCSVRLTANGKCVNEIGSTLTGAGGGFVQAFTFDTGTFENHGSIIVSSNQYWAHFVGDFPFTNTGQITIGAFGSMRFNENPSLLTGGDIEIQPGGYLFSKIYFNGETYSNNSQVQSGGADFVATTGVQFLVGTGKMADLGIAVNSTVALSGTMTITNWVGIFGTLGGSGSLICPSGTPFINTGHITPAFIYTGTLNISRPPTHSVPIANLEMNITAAAMNSYDVLNIGGNVDLSAANLSVTPTDIGIPLANRTILTWTGTRTGDFANVSLPLGHTLSYDDVNKKVNVLGPCFLDLTFSYVKPTCPGNTNGKITAYPTAPTSGYTYLWSDGQTTKTAINLAAGTYTCTVTKTSTGCTASATATLNDPTPITISLSTVHNKCFGQMQGKAVALVSGGTGAKTYLWNTGSTSYQITNLSGGDYSVTATDTKGCTAEAMTTVNTPTQLVLNHTVESLANGKFKVTLAASGGTPYTTTIPYRYCKVGPTGCAFTTTSIYSNLLPGTYTFKARDKNVCEVSIEVTVPPSLMMNDESEMRNSEADARENSSFNIHHLSFSITPNPFDNQLVISFSDLPTFEKLTNLGHLQAQVFDATGRLVFEQNFETGTPAFCKIADTGAWPSGVFFVKILDENGLALSQLRAVKY